MHDYDPSDGIRLSSHFTGWDRQSAELIRSAVETGLIVLDANALLALYEVGSNARDEVFGALERVADRLWLPSQIATEFCRNRHNVVKNRVNRFTSARKSAKSAASAAAQQIENTVTEIMKLRERNRTTRAWDPGKAGVNRESIEDRLSGVMDAALKEIDLLEAEHDLGPQHLDSGDTVYARVDELFAGKVGRVPSSVQLKELTEHAISFRFPNKIPPGYADDKPTELLSAGDYIFWWETLQVAREDADLEMVLIVTSEQKQDWWILDDRKKPIAPHPELIQEMSHEADAVLVLRSLSDFLNDANSYLSANVSPDTLDQVRDAESASIDALSSALFPGQELIPDVRELSAVEFARVTLLLLEATGYKTPLERLEQGGDLASIFVVRSPYFGEGDRSVAVLIKPPSGRVVGVDALTKLRAEMDSLGIPRGLLVTGDWFSPQVMRRAGRQVRLIEASELQSLVQTHLQAWYAAGPYNGEEFQG